jgi:protein-tyrosine-phosphatase
MAAAIANAEIARRLGRPLDDVLRVRTRAESAGLAPRLGSPMDDSSYAALGELAVAAPRHEAREITADQVAAADVIYCMTEAQRIALVERYPAAAAKTRCLDPGGDIPEPTGLPADVYVRVARHIEKLVQNHFDEIGLRTAYQSS